MSPWKWILCFIQILSVDLHHPVPRTEIHCTFTQHIRLQEHGVLPVMVRAVQTQCPVRCLGLSWLVHRVSLGRGRCVILILINIRLSYYEALTKTRIGDLGEYAGTCT